MKVWFRCCKCGKAFEAEDRVRTDICPHCMSFVDLAQAEKITAPDNKNSAEAENLSAAQTTPKIPERDAKGAPPAQKADALAQNISPQGAPAGAEAEDTYETLYAGAEKMMSFGAWGNAADLFRRSIEKRENWLARFGLVRAATRDLTDLSCFSAVTKAAAAAFDKMPAAERLSLGKRYIPALEKKRESLCRSLEMRETVSAAVYSAPVQGNGLVFAARSSLSAPQGKTGKGAGLFVVGVLWLIVFVIVAAMLFAAAPAVGAILLILGTVGGISLIALGARKMSLAKRARESREAVQAVAENSRRVECAELKAQIDAIDYLCGFLKY